MATDEILPRVPIDKQHPRVYRAQLEVAKAVRKATQDAGFDRTLVELVNIRVSQINGCAYACTCTSATSLPAARPRNASPSCRRGATPPCTAQEHAALTLAESLTTLPDARIQEQECADAGAT